MTSGTTSPRGEPPAGTTARRARRLGMGGRPESRRGAAFVLPRPHAKGAIGQGRSAARPTRRASGWHDGTTTQRRDDTTSTTHFLKVVESLSRPVVVQRRSRHPWIVRTGLVAHGTSGWRQRHNAQDAFSKSRRVVESSCRRVAAKPPSVGACGVRIGCDRPTNWPHGQLLNRRERKDGPLTAETLIIRLAPVARFVSHTEQSPA